MLMVISFSAECQATVLPTWMVATGNASINIPSPISAGFHGANSLQGTVAGSAAYSLNGGDLDDWFFGFDGHYESVAAGSPLDMVYGTTRTVEFSVIAVDTLRIVSKTAASLINPSFSQGSDMMTEQQLLRIVAQSDETVVITFEGGGGGLVDLGWGGTTPIASMGGFYEDLVHISPDIAGTHELIAGRTYDMNPPG